MTILVCPMASFALLRPFFRSFSVFLRSELRFDDEGEDEVQGLVLYVCHGGCGCLLLRPTNGDYDGNFDGDDAHDGDYDGNFDGGDGHDANDGDYVGNYDGVNDGDGDGDGDGR